MQTCENSFICTWYLRWRKQFKNIQRRFRYSNSWSFSHLLFLTADFILNARKDTRGLWLVLRPSKLGGTRHAAAEQRTDVGRHTELICRPLQSSSAGPRCRNVPRPEPGPSPVHASVFRVLQTCCCVPASEGEEEETLNKVKDNRGENVS